MLRKTVVGMLAIAMICLAAPIGQARAEAGSMARPYYYAYSLEENAAQSNVSETVFDLYVQGGSAEEGEIPLLHSGNIALGVEQDKALDSMAANDFFQFQPESAYTTVNFSVTSTKDGTTDVDVKPYELGTVNNDSYIAFGWYVDFQQTPALADSRQKIGTLTIARGGVDVSHVKLISWPETTSGQAWYKQLLGAGSDEKAREEVLSYILATWRWADEAFPNDGFYQGYYAKQFAEDSSSTKQQHIVDLTADWLGFAITSYGKEKPATLLFYQAGATTPTAQAVLNAENTKMIFDEETGKVFQQVNFADLTYTNSKGIALTEGLADGSYRMVVVKPSHVTWEIDGLTKNGSVFFPQLTGRKANLPCGNIGEATKDGNGYTIYYGDNRIKLEDRAQLLLFINASISGNPQTPDGTMAYYADLNGDGKFTLADLNILMADENFNHTAVKQP